MPIWVVGRANTALPAEGVVLEGVDIGDVWPSHRLENVDVTIHMVWLEASKLMVGVGVTVQ